MGFSKIIAMDIGSNNIKIIEAKNKKNKIKVNRYLIFDTPDDVVEDGFIIDVDLLALQIKKMLHINKFKTKKVVLTITGTSIITREVILPKANHKDLAAIVRNESANVFPMDITNYTLDYKIIEEFTEEVANNSISKYRVLLVAVPNRMIQGYIDLMKECDLKIESIDYMGNSLSKFINNQEKTLNKVKFNFLGSSKTICAIDMGSHMTTVIIMERGILKFARMFSYNGQKFAQEIINNFELSYDIKNKNDEKNKDDESFRQELYKNLKESNLNVPRFIKEVASVFNFYYTRGDENVLDKIYLVGGSSKIKDIDKYFENIFAVKTEYISDFINVKYSKKIDDFKKVQAHFIGCLGSLINL